MEIEEGYKTESWSTPNFRDWEEERNPAEDIKECQSIREKRVTFGRPRTESSTEGVISCVKCCSIAKCKEVWDTNVGLSKVEKILKFRFLWFTSYRMHGA